MKKKNPFLYRISQFFGFLLGARFFVATLLTFALYVSTFFLFAHEESLRSFVFDFKVHGIIACAVLSILAGGIINQFYDKEKDQITKPFRSRLQSFLKQKYFLYAYLVLVILSLSLAFFISPRVFIFFGIYQFLMWFYSHKLSKILLINNISFVVLTLYPFFGMLVYYQTYSHKISLMALFLFLILVVLDIIKDVLTSAADKVYNYNTIPTVLGERTANRIIKFLLVCLIVTAYFVADVWHFTGILAFYYLVCVPIFIASIVILTTSKERKYYITLNLLRLWIFVGILSMLINGIDLRYQTFLPI